MDQLLHRVLRFDRFTLDLARGCLRVGDQEIDLRPKTFEVLCYLVEHAGRLVPKQELFEAAWPNVSVCDDSLFQCIRELRQKLGDDDHSLIRTAARRGYLLDVTVSVQTPAVAGERAAKLPAVSQRLAREPDLWRGVLRNIVAHRLRVSGAAAVVLGVALIFLVGRLPALVAPPANSTATESATVSLPRSTFRDCADCPEMVALPVGEFMMGAPPLTRDVGAGMPKRVVIDKPIAIGKFEITVDQFSAFAAETRTSAGTHCRAIVGDNGTRFVIGPPEASFRSPGFAVTGSHPALCVSWSDAQEYAAWLKTRTGKPYRLPTDAEWEYAARAGTETYYSFGDNSTALCDYGRFANHDSPFPWRDGCGDDTAGPIPVGRRKANPWGIFDMHGNAWEWVEDCSTPPTDQFSASRDCVDARIVRGGSWANQPWELGSAARRLMDLTWRRSNIGFRVALSLAE
jgi:formylglycine-generating enzyme required for sulfatase activity/DNA-binding winged helix-turn-helix (wHTH) protein